MESGTWRDGCVAPPLSSNQVSAALVGTAETGLAFAKQWPISSWAPRKTIFPSLLCSLGCSHDWILATGKWAEAWPMKQSHMQPSILFPPSIEWKGFWGHRERLRLGGKEAGSLSHYAQASYPTEPSHQEPLHWTEWKISFYLLDHWNSRIC